MKNINRKIVVLIFATTLPIYQGITYAAAPTFDDGDSKTVSVAENTAINTEVVRLPVTDPDDDIVGVVKTGNPWARPGDFKIESSRTDTNQYAAVLKNTVTLDYETQTSYHYTVTVTDENQNTDSISVTINITNDPSDDTSNNPPVFDEGSTTTRSVDKGTYSLQDLGDPVSATDTDDDTLTYTLSGTDAALFEIDSTNGQLRNKNILDYEDKTSYSVTVTVSDNNGGTDTISVTITDDKSPVAVILTFIRQNENWVLELDSVTGVVSAVIPENDRPRSSDSNVASFTRPPGVEFDNSFIVAIVFDEEVSGLAETDLTLTENTAGANVTSSAVIMGWSGNNTVTQYRAKVEVTQSGSVTFNVAADAATDGSGNSNAAVESKTVTVTITLTEYPPWDVNEDGSVDATDLALVTDALGQTGETIVNSRTDVNWDDTVDADDVTLVTYHMDSDPIPNNPPTFVNENGEPIIATNVEVSENLSNYLIGSVKAVDEDEDDTLTYSLDADSNYYSLMPGHKQSYNDLYTINSETGEVHIGSSGLDYDTYPVFSKVPPLKYQPVWIKVEDGNGGSARFAYQVLIKDENDNAPVFSEDSQTLTINENEPSDTTVDTVSASDADVFAGDHIYSIETENVPFTIESSKRSGTIKTTSVLDYETASSYTLTVKVDDGFGTDTIEVTINVTNDPSDDPIPNNPPSFTDGPSTTRSIQENTTSGTNIGSPVSATDSDSGDTLTYSLGGTDAESFSIVSTTGQLQTSASLDYETKNSYEVTVSVSDSNEGSDSITVTISVTNDTSDDPIPNNPPSFTDGPSTTRSIQENTPSGINIGSAISATDKDSGDTLEYTLGGTDSGSFSIVSTTGQLQTNVALDYENKKSYEVTVSVSDGNGGSDSITVTITVDDVDENPSTDPVADQQVSEPGQDDVTNSAPVFDDSPSTTRFIVENTASGANIGLPVSATDGDSGDTLEYTLSGTDAGSFSINSSTGQLITSDALDYETKNSYQVEVSVSDGNGGTDSITVTIEVTAETENQQQTTEGVTAETENQQQITEGVTAETENQQQITEEETTLDPSPQVEPTTPLSTLSAPGQIGFSELMFASRGGLHSLPQWIELYNNSDTEAVNLRGWKLQIEARDANGKHRYVVIPLEEVHIPASQTVLIVTWIGRNSEDFPEDRVYNFFDHHSNEFEQNVSRNMLLGLSGFYLKLSDPDGVVSDETGNLDGDAATEDKPEWEIPAVTTEYRTRTSLMRRYDIETGVPLDGTALNSWRRTADFELSVSRYWGSTTDIGNPGYRSGTPLPVTLSRFRAERVKSSVVLKWTTESELDNAGFNILRSESRDGAFRQVNSRMIQGAGTTGERNTYTWMDTTANRTSSTITV